MNIQNVASTPMNQRVQDMSALSSVQPIDQNAKNNTVVQNQAQAVQITDPSLGNNVNTLA